MMNWIGRLVCTGKWACLAFFLGGALNAAPVVIEGARVVDTAELQVLDDMVLVIEEPLIRAMGRRGSVDIPEGATVIDARGRTLMPGMFDLHTHNGLTEGLAAGPDYYNEQRIQRDANWALYFGVMHMVSLGFDREPMFALRGRQREGQATGARLYVAGSGFVPVGGWRPPLPPESIDFDEWLSIPHTPEQAREMVRRQAARDVDLIKIWIDDLGGEAVKFSPEFYGAIIDEAHRVGLRVVAHVMTLDDGKGLIRSGADGLAHVVSDRPVDDEFIELARAKNIAQMATLASMRYGADYAAGTTGYLDHPMVEAIVPADWRSALRSADYQARAAPRAQAEEPERAMVLENLQKLAQAGIQVVLGTDAGGSPARFHGLANHLELEDMVAAGLSPLEAIRAATLNSARFLGVDNIYGSLATGKVADFVVLGGDPSTDIANTMTIEAVWMNGKRVDREALASATDSAE